MQTNENKIQNALIDIINGLKQSMRVAMNQHNVSLSPLYFIVLKHIDEDEQCTAIKLASKLQKDKGQITRLIKELEVQELLTREPNTKDKRSFFLSLTRKGKNCYKTLEKHDIEALQVMMQGLSDEQIAAFIEIANTMAANLAEHNQQAPH